MPQTVRLSDDIVEMARVTSGLASRSLSGQVELWARIGRAIERSPGFDYERVTAALGAELSPDELTGEEQAVYYDEFFALLEQPSEIEDAFFAKMRAEGRGVGLDEKGELVYGKNEPEYVGD